MKQSNGVSFPVCPWSLHETVSSCSFCCRSCICHSCATSSAERQHRPANRHLNRLWLSRFQPRAAGGTKVSGGARCQAGGGAFADADGGATSGRDARRQEDRRIRSAKVSRGWTENADRRVQSLAELSGGDQHGCGGAAGRTASWAAARAGERRSVPG